MTTRIYLAICSVTLASLLVWGVLWWTFSWDNRARCEDALLGYRQSLIQGSTRLARNYYEAEIQRWCP